MPEVEVYNVSAGMDGARRWYTVVYRVKFLEGEPRGPGMALRAPGVAKVHQAYDIGTEHDTRAFCTSKRATHPDGTNSTFKFLVTCEFSTLNREQKKRMQHPVDRPAEVSTTFHIFSAIMEKDINGVAVLNTAGQPFDPPLERDDGRRILTVTKNLATPMGAAAFNYQNHINSVTFLGAAPGTLKCNAVADFREFEEFGEGDEAVEVEFWPTTFEFEYNPDGWQKRPLNAGRYELNGAGKLVPITDGNGEPVADPWPLDALGAKIDPATLPNSAVFLSFDGYHEVDFNALNLF